MPLPSKLPVEPSTKPVLGAAACPRCNCWLITSFARQDGTAKPHTEHCVLCGRYTELPAGEGLEGWPENKNCTFGNTMHTHPTT